MFKLTQQPTLSICKAMQTSNLDLFFQRGQTEFQQGKCVLRHERNSGASNHSSKIVLRFSFIDQPDEKSWINYILFRTQNKEIV